jgi:hypothetical protein
MTDVPETIVAPSAIEKVVEIFESLKSRDHAALVQAWKASTEQIFAQIAAGQTDPERLVISGIVHLKSLERMTDAQ